MTEQNGKDYFSFLKFPTEANKLISHRQGDRTDLVEFAPQ